MQFDDIKTETLNLRVSPRPRSTGTLRNASARCSRRSRQTSLPSTRADFWREKLQGNAARDRATLTELQAMGWRSLWVWECALRDEETLSDLPRALKAWIEGSEPFGAIAGPTCSAVNLEAG